MPDRHECPGSDLHRQGPDRPGRHPQQVSPGCQRHPGRVPGLRQGGGREPGRQPVQLYRRRQRQAAARAYDEHPQRRRPRHQQCGDPGVHDYACLRPLLPGGPAPLCRSVSRPEGCAEGERHSRCRCGRRGRLRPQSEEG